MESKTPFCGEAANVSDDKVLKGNSVADRTWGSAKLSVLEILI